MSIFAFSFLTQSYMLVKTYGSAIIGVSAMTVTVEVSMAEGSGFFMVGLPDNTEHFIR